MYEIRHYLSESDKDIYQQWRDSLRDTKAAIAIDRRIYRMELGNFGDHRFIKDGVSELRIDVGPGYRLYYAVQGNQIILLLTAGNKRTQISDIDQACLYWRDWQRRS